MKILLFLLMFFLTTSCDKHISDAERQRNEKQHAINTIMQKTATRLKNTTGLSPCGTGSQAMHKIEMLSLSFFYYKPITVDEGRKLLITAVDEFVTSINLDEKIYPYLKSHPFKPQNIEIIIFLRSPNGSNPPSGELYDVSSQKGVFSYSIIDPKTNRLEHLYEEPYNEALLRAAGNTAGLPELQPLPPHKPPDPNKKIGIGFCS